MGISAARHKEEFPGPHEAPALQTTKPQLPAWTKHFHLRDTRNEVQLSHSWSPQLLPCMPANSGTRPG